MTDHPTPLCAVFAVNTTPTAVVRAIHNLLDAAAEPVTIEVVCFGPGLGEALRCSDISLEMRALIDLASITVKACRNSLDGRGLGDDDLLMGVEMVPAAVFHIARRQRDGSSQLYT
ncbi:DsrE family protein [Rhodococcus erythropolis]|uniref:DsrE family protein n=1 Tax=Rhodococcus erythropolis TaxID=1833 RepID=UPI000878FFA2|nr:DsrE family protein [Rhodococcus erythropolis]OFV79076.1 DsrE/DsrF-like family protein [Rhodococcus erythropolis]